MKTLSSWSRASWLRVPLVILAVSGPLLLSGCSDDDDDDDSDSDTTETTKAPLLPENGTLQADIRRTTNGVPHVKANDLSSASFGLGYAEAQDNVCVLADAFVKARSERAKYFGPGNSPGNPADPPTNIISDFSYKALDIYVGAEREIETLSDESHAMIDGFTAGYNKYVKETDPADLPETCRNQPWVKEISPVDLLAYYRIVGQYASGDQFATGAVFVAVPPEGTSDPEVVMPSVSANDAQKPAPTGVAEAARMLASRDHDYNDFGLGSNAWGIGKDLTEQGRGALLANPHFPYTGHRRFYQVQMTVPGYLNINGAGLLGTAIPLINYNENLAWSHTVTTSRRFTFYELTLKSGDNLTYIKDGEEKPITKKTFQIEVANGSPTPTVLKRTFYFSEYGPMVSANAATRNEDGTDGLPTWGKQNSQGTTVAYTYRDANADTSRLLDTWLKMSLASNLDEFQDVFRKDCGSTLWTNTTYADDQGNAFYIDSSSVPNLSAATLANVDFKRRFSDSYNELFKGGITLLDGSTSRDDWVEGECGGLVPYKDKPKLQRTDFVQNSNSSYWATNPKQFLTGFSPMFGPDENQPNMRTRLGLSMLMNPMDKGYADKAPAGQDGKFSGKELIEVVYNNRSWYAKQFLGELRQRCEAAPASVNVLKELLPDDLRTSVPATYPVTNGCEALDGWDGVYNLDSKGAHLFRVFIDIYARNFLNPDSDPANSDDFPYDLTVAFNPNDPVSTPAKPTETQPGQQDDPMLESLAASLVILDDVGIDPAAKLRDVQYYQPTGNVPPGSSAIPTAPKPKIPWHGGDGNVEGTFNAVGVVDSDVKEDTRIPRQNADEYIITDDKGNKTRVAAGLSTDPISPNGGGWRMARGTSWHFGLEFTDNGPKAFGLVSYSESSDPMSPYFNDQSQRYSDKNYRAFSFTEDEIQANLLDQGESTISN